MNADETQDYPDVLVRAAPEEIEDKRRANIDDPHGTECYWSVSGTPQRTGRGGAMLFHDGDGVWGVATITRVEDGRIWFRPIRDAPWAFEPVDPPTRGFAYVEADTA